MLRLVFSMLSRVAAWFVGITIAGAGCCALAVDFPWRDGGPGLGVLRITNDGPVIFSAVRIDREHFRKDLTLVTTLASNTVVGTEPMPAQVRALPKDWGTPVAAMNADFFLMSGSAKGDPRGLHIWRGELVSVPTGPAAFWMDDNGEPHGEAVRSKLTVSWPGGGTHLAGLNETMWTNAMVLFTPTMGDLYPPTNARSSSVRSSSSVRTTSTGNTTINRTVTNRTPVTNSASRSTIDNSIPRGGPIRPPGGREWILERTGGGPWLPLRVGQTYQARVVATLNGFTNVPSRSIILSFSSNTLARLGPLTNGTRVTISVGTEPDLTGIQHALGTGPMLVRAGKLHDVNARMSEQDHPRAAIGWNERFLFLAVSDGRRKGISEGIRLSEMAEFMVELGCAEAINMDGGQSTTLMLNNEIVNAQTPGGKHEVANGVVILRAPSGEEDIDK